MDVGGTSFVRPGCRFSVGLVILLSLLISFWAFFGHLLPQESQLDLPRIAGRDLQEVAGAKKSTAGGLDGWAWNEVKALSLTQFSGLAILLELVESTGVWPQGVLDASIAILGQRPLVVLPVVYMLWASLRLGHLRDWVEGWLPKSVFSLGNGLFSRGLVLHWVGH